MKNMDFLDSVTSMERSSKVPLSYQYYVWRRELFPEGLSQLDYLFSDGQMAAQEEFLFLGGLMDGQEE
jgi:hypothetical protein